MDRLVLVKWRVFCASDDIHPLYRPLWAVVYQQMDHSPVHSTKKFEIRKIWKFQKKIQDLLVKSRWSVQLVLRNRLFLWEFLRPRHHLRHRWESMSNIDFFELHFHHRGHCQSNRSLEDLHPSRWLHSFGFLFCVPGCP